ncbi:hypothetical protein BDN67DRAFT_968093 [Paxillus ammoniavirescens]|nr:hypothetical protein BDN67DRAFT_968093 [Paxillus ammoniavirescens]
MVQGSGMKIVLHHVVTGLASCQGSTCFCDIKLSHHGNTFLTTTDHPLPSDGVQHPIGRIPELRVSDGGRFDAQKSDQEHSPDRSVGALSKADLRKPRRLPCKDCPASDGVYACMPREQLGSTGTPHRI